MKTKNADLAKMALESLRGRWGLAVGAYAIYILISVVLGFMSKDMNAFSSAVSFIIGGPFALGYAMISLKLSRNQPFEVEEVFNGFKNFWKSLGLYFFMALFVILWALLLIIPGIIAALSYSMAFYIMADNPNIRAMEALDRSKEMMRGYKWKLLGLYLRFIGWGLLCILTLGIGFLWLIPYMNVSFAKFYEDIKNKEEKTETPQESIPESN